MAECRTSTAPRVIVILSISSTGTSKFIVSKPYRSGMAYMRRVQREVEKSREEMRHLEGEIDKIEFNATIQRTTERYRRREMHRRSPPSRQPHKAIEFRGWQRVRS